MLPLLVVVNVLIDWGVPRAQTHSDMFAGAYHPARAFVGADGSPLSAGGMQRMKGSPHLAIASAGPLGGGTVFGLSNQSPVVAPLSGVTAKEGDLVSLPPAAFTDGDPGDTHSAIVNWGDGTSSAGTVTESAGAGTVQASHAYGDNGVYSVIVTVTDDVGAAGVATFFVTVTNVAPAIDQSSLPGQTVAFQTPVLVAAAFRDPGFSNPAAGSEETFSATINWGDGHAEPAAGITLTTSAGSPGVPTTGSIQAQHLYAAVGDYTALVCMADDDGARDCKTFVAHVIQGTGSVIVTGPTDLTYGTAGIATATANGTGAVTFSVGASTGCTVAGTTMTVTDATGTCVLTATKAADSNYTSATSAPFSVTLHRSTQAPLVVTAPTDVTFGTPAPATATGGSGIGALSFSVGASTGCTVAGVTVTVTDATGTCVLTATKAADANYTAATSSPFSVILHAVNGATSTVTALPTSVTADGIATSTITVTLKDAGSSPVSGKMVVLAAGSGSSTITTVSGTTGVSGQATFTVKDAVAQGVTYTATDTDDGVTVTPTVTVTFTAGAVNGATSTMVALPTSVTADSLATSAITVTLKDASSNPVSGKTVTLAAGSGSSTITTLSGTTNSSGQAAFTVKDAVAQAVTYTATDTTDNVTVAQTATVTFTTGAAVAASSTLTPASGTLTANGTSTQVLTVQARDASGNDVTTGGSTVTIIRLSGTGTIGGVTDNGNGTYTASVTAPTATGSGVFVATLGGQAVQSGTASQTLATLTYAAGALDHFLVEAAGGGTIATQTAGTPFSIRVTAQDVSGNTVASFASPVSLTSTGSLLGDPVSTPAFTAGVLASQSVTITSAGSFTITATGSVRAGTSAPFTVNAVAQTLLTTQVPAITNAGSYELGLRVVPDTTGQITAVRFWKATGETGTHTGRVWSGSGQLLVSVVFANETASGWQEQALTAPLATLANAAYIVSVNANSAWVGTASFFAVPLVNGHLQGPAINNGVYGAAGGFPTSTYQSYNYFRDLVFVPDAGVPTRILGLSGTLAFGNVATNTTATRTLTIGNTGTAPLTVSGISYPAGFSGDWTAGTIAPGGSQAVMVTFAPTAVAGYGGSIAVTGDQTSGANTIAASGTGIVPVASQTLLTTQIPTSTNTGSYELGLRVVPDMTGQITAVRFWKAAGETGAHTGRVWSASGQLLAAVAFVNETPSGWQEQTLATPLATLANAAYIVSVNANSAWVGTGSFFAVPLLNGHLQGPAGNNGVYGAAGGFPTSTYQSYNYFRDVVFAPDAGVPTRILGLSGTLAFGNVAANTTATRTLTISNTGTAPLTVSGISYPAGFSGDWAGGTIAPGGSQAVMVTFAPTAVAGYGGSITVTGDQTSGANTIAASGTGIVPVSSQTLLTTQIPVSTNAGSYELGLRVVPDTTGQFTAVRFWKAAGDAGTHTGRVWSASGQLLAAVAFVNETASGWQEQALASPVATLANAVYIVSVNANSAWVGTASFFAAALVNGHLQGPSINNGVYGAAGGFPTSTYQSYNYFRDVVFAPDAGVPTRILGLSGNLAFGNVATNTTATRSLTISNLGTAPLTVSGISYPAAFSGDWAAGTIAPGGSQAVTVTFAPTAVAGYGGSITVTGDQTGGANTIAASGTGIVSAPAQTLLTTQGPTSTNAGSYELGLRLVADTTGQITAVRFWKAAGETGTHTGRVWSASGQLLASVVFANETASGWQEQALASPVATLANTPYIVSANANSVWVGTGSFFAVPLVNGHLQAPAGNNGIYGAAGGFPAAAYQSYNYFRDVVFVPQ